MKRAKGLLRPCAFMAGYRSKFTFTFTFYCVGRAASYPTLSDGQQISSSDSWVCFFILFLEIPV